MTLKYGPNLAQLIGAAAGDEHYQAILSQWRALDGLVQPAISSRVTTLPTTDMLEGDRYLVTSGSYANRIARYREANTEAGLGAGWEYFTPREGWYVWSIADKRGYRYSNGGWIDATFQGGTLSAAINEAPAVSLASAATLAIGAAPANTIQVTGTTAITAFDTIAAGARRTLRFSDALTLTHNATSLILPRGANVVTVGGDVADFVSLGGGNWVCVGYQRFTAAGAKGDLALVKADVGLGSVDNTSDVDKPVSSAAQTALNAKVSTSVLEAAGLANATPNKSAVSCDDAPLGATIRYEGTQSNATTLNYPTSASSSTAQVAFSVFTFGIGGPSARVAQEATEIFGAPGALNSGRGRTFFRVKHDGNWYPWRELVFLGSSPTFGGYLTVSRTDAYDTAVDLQGPAGKPRYTVFRTGTSPRWYFGADGAAEGGSNAGTNFFIDRYNDSGAYMGKPLQISRATGQTILEGLSVAGPSRVGQYTLASLPSASAYSGFEIDVTDAAGGPKRCRSNGTDWQILNTTTKVS